MSRFTLEFTSACVFTKKVSDFDESYETIYRFYDEGEVASAKEQVENWVAVLGKGFGVYYDNDKPYPYDCGHEHDCCGCVSTYFRWFTDGCDTYLCVTESPNY